MERDADRGAVVIVASGIVMLALPSFGEPAANRSPHRATETPPPLTDGTGKMVYPGFPADLLYSFRLYSLGAQLLMWTAIALVFAPLAERLLTPSAQRTAVAAGVQPGGRGAG